MRHSLQFALDRVLFKIFAALSKDTYKDISKYFGIMPMDEQISARQSKFYLRYCASESAVSCGSGTKGHPDRRPRDKRPMHPGA